MSILKNNKNLLHLTPIETERLKLVQLDTCYAKDFYTEFNEDITRLMLKEPFKDLNDAFIFLQKSIIKNQSGTAFYLVILSKEGEFIGTVGLSSIETAEPSFVVWVKISAQGKGYGKEAIKTLYDSVQGEIDYEYLHYPVDKTNLASCKIPRSLGGHITAEYELKTPKGTILHCIDYKIK